jgi:hypothetical protein
MFLTPAPQSSNVYFSPLCAFCGPFEEEHVGGQRQFSAWGTKAQLPALELAWI